jgi:tripartite-type tricarboxylate transporter receptor subunit TctC
VSALLSGTVQMFFGNISDSIEQVRSGKFRLLALSSEKRSPQFPDVPTVAETVPGFSMIGWHGVFAPAGTPRQIIERLSGTLRDLGRDAEYVRILGNVGIDTVSGSPEDLARAVQEDIVLYRAAIEAAGLLRKDGTKRE